MTNKIFKKLSFFLLFLSVISYNLENKAEAQACSWTKSGNHVCANDLNSLYKMHPVAQLRQETTTVNGKLVNPTKTNTKDAPYTAAGNQKIGDPRDVVKQTGKTGTKSSFEIARDKKIAADNFRKQQEAAELMRQKNKTQPNKNCTMVKDKRTGTAKCVYPETGIAR